MEIESRLRRLLDGFSALVAYWDAQLRNRYANRAYAEWFGLTPESMQGKHFADVLNQQMRERIQPHLQRVLAGEEQRFEVSITGDQGQVRHCDAHYLPDRVGGEVVGFFVVVFDVTALKNTRDELAEAQRLGKLGSWAWDAVADRITWSPELYALFGRDPARPPPTYAELPNNYTPDSWVRHQQVVDEALRSGRSYEAELEIVRDDGTHGWIVAHGQAWRNAQGEVVKLQGTAQDVTERKRMELALLDSRNELRDMVAHQETAREQERRHIAHELHDELGQLLSALNMDIGVLRMQAAADSRQKKALQDMQAIVDRIFQITRNVTTSLRPGALEFGLVPALEWLVQDFNRRWGIECTLDVSDEAWPLDEWRAAAVFRIAQESLTNVARHACASRVQITLRRAGGMLHLQVRDNGCGFDAAQSRTPNRFGLLGMRERALSMGGRLTIDSALGRGTQVELVVPMQPG